MSSINSENIDQTNKEMNPGGDQGQGLEASNVAQSEEMHNKDMSQADPLDSELISNTNISENNSESIPGGMQSSEPPEHLIDTGVSVPVITSPTDHTNDLSSDIQCIGASGDNAHDLQRNSDTKSPEMLMEEVREEVTKLNISGEEPKTGSQPIVRPSKVELRQQSDSLMNLLVYDDSDSDSEADSQDDKNKPEQKERNIIKVNKNNTKVSLNIFRDEGSDSSDSETDSSASTLSSDSGSEDCDSVSVISENDECRIRTDDSDLNKSTDKGAVKKPNKSFELPPIPDLTNLNISSAEEFLHIGVVTSIIENLVTIETIRGMPAFDLDSMLFIDVESTKKPLGPIDDVIGPVSEPMYCVRFNNEDEITKLGVKFGMKVYAAPKSEEFTKFVFVKELMKIRGTDASWLNDQEQPIELGEFSDDEMERQARKPAKTHQKRKLDDNSLERHKKYERTMNQCNTLNTRVCRLVDAQKNLSKQIRTTQHQRDSQEPPAAPVHELPTWVPPEFNPAVPPPVFGHPTPYGWPVTPPLAGMPHSFVHGTQGKYAVVQPMPAPFGSPAQFGTFYANQAFAPQTVGPPASRSQSRCTGRARFGQPQTLRQSSDNYFSNNSRNKDAGPSSQPF